MNDNEPPPLVATTEFRDMAKPMIDLFKLRHSLKLDSTLTPDASKAMSEYIDRLATMLDLQADMLKADEHIRSLTRKLFWLRLKLAAQMVLIILCGVLFGHAVRNLFF